MPKSFIKTILIAIFIGVIFPVVLSASASQFIEEEQGGVKLIEGREHEFIPFEAEANMAIYRLTNLGIMEGYPDGTFGEQKTITRAEFAKLAVTIAGFREAAMNEQKNPSNFVDVDSESWANGWINVAVIQQLIKGDGNGKYRPDNTITQAEAVTVLLRILGYNDNIPGIWPADYIAKAAQLGILDKMIFLANSAATRAEVAVVISGVLDQFMVEYNAANNSFENILMRESDIIPNGNPQKEVPYTLLHVFSK